MFQVLTDSVVIWVLYFSRRRTRLRL